jgi:hypothetical protein
MNGKFGWRVLLIPGLLIVLCLCGRQAVAGSESTALAAKSVDAVSGTFTTGAELSPAVTISPTSGPPGTLIQVVATGFQPNMSIMVGVGPAGRGFAVAAQGEADKDGVFTAQVAAPEAPGVDLAFAISAAQGPGAISPELFHITDAPEK